jgi:glycosyltransferase involved in cell wall biosynthesis
VSACLIVQNEQERLPACLRSVAFCAETIVVDGGSTDATVRLAHEAGAEVIENPWPGYAAQRNVALTHASHDWVLEIDADERVTERLREEIEAFVQAPQEDTDVASMPIRHVFLGRRLGPAVRYPTYRNRLFRRSRYTHDETRAVHEGIYANGVTHPLTGDLEHRLADSWHEALADCWAYARLEASHLQPPAGANAYLKGIVVRPLVKFFWRTFVFAAWRDGWQGLVQIALQVATDSIVWTRLLGRRLRHPSATDHTGASGHFATNSYRGPARLVAVADDEAGAQRASAWLAAAAAAGADVALIAPPNGDRSALPLGSRLLARGRPFTLVWLIRAVDREMQLRSIDALIGFGPCSERLLAKLPYAVRGAAPALGEKTDPAEALASGLAARPGGD